MFTKIVAALAMTGALWVAGDAAYSRLDCCFPGSVCCDPPHWNIAVQMGGRRLTSARDLMVLPEAGLSTSPVVIEEKPELVKGMVRATLRGAEFGRQNREETIDCILRHNVHITRDMASLAWDQDHEDWGPVLDMQAHQRKVDIYTREWNLPKKPVSTYYTFRFLREALDELGLLRSWDPALDAASGFRREEGY